MIDKETEVKPLEGVKAIGVTILHGVPIIGRMRSRGGGVAPWPDDDGWQFDDGSLIKFDDGSTIAFA